MAQKTDTSELSEQTIVFSGKNYSLWRTRIVAALGAAGLKSLMQESEEDRKYLKLLPAAREIYMRGYDQMQDKGKAIIYDRVSNYYLRRIRNCSTIREILEELDRDFLTPGDLEEGCAVSRLFTLQYTMGENMYDYVATFETRWDEYEEIRRYKQKSEGKMYEEAFPEKDKIDQLHYSVSSVTDTYDLAKVRFALLPAADQTYENFRNEPLRNYRVDHRDECFI